MTGYHAHGRPTRWLAMALFALTGLYAASGLAAMLWLSPKVPYADPWRFLAALASRPFPGNVLHADNGHREVLPNLVRLIELHWLDANQWLQVVIGAALALATAVLLWRGLREVQRAPLRVSALSCAIAVMVFWLGNERTLTHGNESLHAYLVTLCVVGGLHLLRRPEPRTVALAMSPGLIASFSFGAGMACFAAFAVQLWLQKAAAKSWAILAVAAMLSVALYLAGAERSISIGFSPLQQLDMGLRWLASPFMYMFWPLVDPEVAAQVPVAPARQLAVAAATGWQAAFGPLPAARFPWLVIGAAGPLLWGLLARRAHARAAAGAMPVMASTMLGLSMFGLAVGALVMLARVDYFAGHPDQLMAPRYVVWSSLFWGGLLLSWISLAANVGRAAQLVALIALLALPSQAWMARLAWTTRGVAELAAVGAAVGVLAEATATGETVPSELVAALPYLRRREASIFAWPETKLLGNTVDAGGLAAVAADGWRIEPVANRLDGEGGAYVALDADAGGARLLIIDAGGRAVGIAMPDRAAGGNRWHGWVREPLQLPLRATVLK